MAFAEVRNTRLYYEDEGEGPAVLPVHGWGSSGRVWQTQLPDLVRDHRVVTLDWRGCGRSDRPAPGNTIAGDAADLAEVLTSLELDRPVVAGSSIGAVFATELGLARPELVGGVVAVDGPGYWPSVTMRDEHEEIRAAPATDRPGVIAGCVPTWYAPGPVPRSPTGPRGGSSTRAPGSTR
ncbi:alpha/beta fold hydrolase [Amycolatopsis sp. FDAARGOS 1241]|uniref:alpha/beta fold hydrolase n=1 Tax=Amycolatopsis sp. FDAARGOS 1241 TaxID=2778070 RepID=UPI001EF1DFBF|nr:alpha/beta hydrolase [Amycolatopsis sp. FDAARGOS 1241]